MRARFERATAVAVFALNTPILLLLAYRRHDLDDADASLLGWSIFPAFAFLPIVYGIARRYRAPFPSSAVTVSFLAGGVGWMFLLIAASDMTWGDLLAEPPERWMTRGPAGLLAIGFNAVFTAKWCSQAVLSDSTPAGD